MIKTKKRVLKAAPATRKKAKKTNNQASYMDKVKIKRVKKVTKKASTKDKVLAGLGLGSTLLGGISAVAPKPSSTQFVRTQTNEEGTTTGKVKDTLNKIFGVDKAKAAGFHLTPGASSVTVNVGAGGGMSFSVTDESGQQVSVDASQVSVSSSNSSVAWADVEGSLIGIRGVAPGTATITISYGGASGSFQVTVPGTTAGSTATQTQGSTGTAAAHSYTISADAPSVAINVGAGGGMTFTVRDETGSVVTPDMSKVSVSSSNGAVASVGIESGMVGIRGNQAGSAVVTVSYGGSSSSFTVTVNSPQTATAPSGSSGTQQTNTATGSTTSTSSSGTSSGTAMTPALAAYYASLGINVPATTSDSTSTYTPPANPFNPNPSPVTVTTPQASYSVSADAGSLTLSAGTSGGMTFTVRDQNGQIVLPDYSKVTVSSSNGSIAQADLEGGIVGVRAVSPGTTSIFINYQGANAAFMVTVEPAQQTAAPIYIGTEQTGASSSRDVLADPRSGDTFTEDAGVTYTYKDGSWIANAGQEKRSEADGFVYIADGKGGWTLKDGQTQTVGGTTYVSYGGQWTVQNQPSPSGVNSVPDPRGSTDTPAPAGGTTSPDTSTFTSTNGHLTETRSGSPRTGATTKTAADYIGTGKQWGNVDSFLQWWGQTYGISQYGQTPKTPDANAIEMYTAIMGYAPYGWESGVTVNNAYDGTSQSVWSGDFASKETAQRLAERLGGTVVEQTSPSGDPFTYSQPMYSIKVGNAMLNAGSVARTYEMYPEWQADLMIQTEIAQANGRQAPSWEEATKILNDGGTVLGVKLPPGMANGSAPATMINPATNTLIGSTVTAGGTTAATLTADQQKLIADAPTKNVWSFTSEEKSFLDSYFGNHPERLPQTFVPGSYTAYALGVGDNTSPSAEILEVAKQSGYTFTNGTYVRTGSGTTTPATTPTQTSGDIPISYFQNVTNTLPDGTVTHMGSTGYASYETAKAIADRLGGRVIAMGNRGENVPQYQIVLDGGRYVGSAGWIAHEIEQYGWDYTLQMINAERAMAQGSDPVKLYSQAPTATGDPVQDILNGPKDSEGILPPLSISQTAQGQTVTYGTTNLASAAATASGSQQVITSISSSLQLNTNLSKVSTKNVVITSIAAHAPGSANALGFVGPGYTIEIKGQGLDKYKSATLVVDGRDYSATVNITGTAITIQVPALSVAAGSQINVRLISQDPDIASGIVGANFFYLPAQSGTGSQSAGDNLDLGTLSGRSSSSGSSASAASSTRETTTGTSTSFGSSNSSGSTAGTSSSFNASSNSSGNSSTVRAAAANVTTQSQGSGSTNQTAGNQYANFQGLKYQDPGLQMPDGYAASANPGNTQVLGSTTGTKSTYTIKKGDTLWSIAKRYYGDGRKWRQVLEANTNKIKNPKTLQVGTQIVIPELKK